MVLDLKTVNEHHKNQFGYKTIGSLPSDLRTQFGNKAIKHATKKSATITRYVGESSVYLDVSQSSWLHVEEYRVQVSAVHCELYGLNLQSYLMTSTSKTFSQCHISCQSQ